LIQRIIDWRERLGENRSLYDNEKRYKSFLRLGLQFALMTQAFSGNYQDFAGIIAI
jgi:hypothetical protein